MRAGGRGDNEPMREAYVHDAVLLPAPDADEGAPGAAITTALCGSWQHEPPCPLAPHHTAVRRNGNRLHVRTLFVAAPDQVNEVRRRITVALADGGSTGPDGVVSRWQLQDSGPGALRADEHDHAARLMGAAGT